MTDKIQMDWERPDWHLLYHELLYTVLPWNILDKRTHQKAHTQTMSEAERLREAEDKLSRYRVALAKIREHCQRWANSANMTIEAYGRKQAAAVISHEYSNAGIDPKEFDE